MTQDQLIKGKAIQSLLHDNESRFYTLSRLAGCKEVNLTSPNNCDLKYKLSESQLDYIINKLLDDENLIKADLEKEFAEL